MGPRTASRIRLFGSREGTLLREADELWNSCPVPICLQSTRLSFTDAAIVLVARQPADGLVLTFDNELRKEAAIRVPEA